MSKFYYAYLKDKTLDPLNNCVDAASFHVDDPEMGYLLVNTNELRG